jgi:hypothetical protein
MNPLIKKVSVLFSQVYEDVRTYFSNTYSQSLAVFGPSSAYGQIMIAIAAFAQKVMFYIEDSVNELNINTATRKSSVYGLSRLTGHNPTRAMGATGDIYISFTGESVQAANNQIVIPNLTLIRCVNTNIDYVILAAREEIRMTVGSPAQVRTKIIQGKIETQNFTGTGLPLQSFNAVVQNNDNIDNHFVNIYVNGEEYKAYDSFYDMPPESPSCLVRTSLNSGIDIIFGNGQYGKIPQPGSTITVQYLLTLGSFGNIIDMTDRAKFIFIDPVFDALGRTIDANSALSIKLATKVVLGTSPEPIELTKLLAPRASKSFVLARAENYIYFLQKLNYFSIVDAFDTFNDDYLDDDNIIYVYLVPDITKRLKSNENYFSIDIAKFNLFDDEVSKIREYVRESGSMLVTSEMRILRPVIKKYVLNISIVVFENYSLDLIRSSIVSSINEYLLTFVRRDRIPQSDIVSVIEGIEGVDSVNVRFMCEENERSKEKWLAELSTNPNAVEPVDIGLDAQGDIIIGKGELPVIRGGWYDRYGNFYNDTIDFNTASPVNIEIKDILSQSIYNRYSTEKIKKLKSK